MLVDCLQPLNSGPQAFNDMRLALTQLMHSFHYGQRTLFRRLFSPVIDKLLFAATKADHVTVDQHGNMVSLLQQLIQDAWQNAAFEGITMDCLGLASVQATQSGLIDVNGEKIPGATRSSIERRRTADRLSRRGAGSFTGSGVLG
ncbi:Predicted ATPase [Kluyvera cryocrescens]|uniref:Predicted ATPase n=1 Tax=Kluyvera cryocrescens TaxID=580 RepID=A0A485A2E0_KLUCR|nr:Predicted ATPase [Kluyvera cryocrescens]